MGVASFTSNFSDDDGDCSDESFDAAFVPPTEFWMKIMGIVSRKNQQVGKDNGSQT